jgi:hypothetical protein
MSFEEKRIGEKFSKRDYQELQRLSDQSQSYSPQVGFEVQNAGVNQELTFKDPGRARWVYVYRIYLGGEKPVILVKEALYNHSFGTWFTPVGLDSLFSVIPAPHLSAFSFKCYTLNCPPGDGETIECGCLEPENLEEMKTYQPTLGDIPCLMLGGTLIQYLPLNFIDPPSAEELCALTIPPPEPLSPTDGETSLEEGTDCQNCSRTIGKPKKQG